MFKNKKQFQVFLAVAEVCFVQSIATVINTIVISTTRRWEPKKSGKAIRWFRLRRSKRYEERKQPNEALIMI